MFPVSMKRFILVTEGCLGEKRTYLLQRDKKKGNNHMNLFLKDV